VTRDDSIEQSVADFAKQIFGAPQNSSELGINFVKLEPAEEKVALTPAEPKKIAAVEESNPAANKSPVASAEDPVTETPGTAVVQAQEPQPSVPKEAGANKDGERQLRTTSEMADIILNALRTVDGVPKRGFAVTVYGANPWNAMLTIKPEAGPIRDAKLWQTRVQDIAARLRRDYDVIHEK
jgi:hypothetical protein